MHPNLSSLPIFSRELLATKRILKLFLLFPSKPYASHLEQKLAGRTSVSRASYAICRAKDKMKMGGPLFKKYLEFHGSNSRAVNGSFSPWSPVQLLRPMPVKLEVEVSIVGARKEERWVEKGGRWALPQHFGKRCDIISFWEFLRRRRASDNSSGWIYAGQRNWPLTPRLNNPRSFHPSCCASFARPGRGSLPRLSPAEQEGSGRREAPGMTKPQWRRMDWS